MTVFARRTALTATVTAALLATLGGGGASTATAATRLPAPVVAWQRSDRVAAALTPVSRRPAPRAPAPG